MVSGRVSITFDDALASVYSLALPELERFALSGTVYAISELIGEEYLGYPVMTKPMMLDLVSKGWEIGSHTRSHPRLTDLQDREIRNELEVSKSHLEEAANCKVTSLAYPYGDVNNRVAQLASDYYTCARKVSHFPYLRLNSLIPGDCMKLNAMSACDSAFTLPIHLCGNLFPTANKNSVKRLLSNLRSHPQNDKPEKGAGLNPTLVEKWIKIAVKKRSWLILCFHNITSDKVSTAYTISLKKFHQIIKAVATVPEVIPVGNAFQNHER